MGDCSVIISSCDKFEFCWEGWYRTFLKYWNFNLDWPIYFVNESKKFPYQHDRIQQITTGDIGFCERLQAVVGEINTDYILFMLEEQWLIDYVDDRLFTDLYESMWSYDMAGLKVQTATPQYYELEKSDIELNCQNFLKVTGGPWVFSHQAAFWERELFLNLMTPENPKPQMNEILGTEILKTRFPEKSVYLYHHTWYAMPGVVDGGVMTGMGQHIMHLIDCDKQTRAILDG